MADINELIQNWSNYYHYDDPYTREQYMTAHKRCPQCEILRRWSSRLSCECKKARGYRENGTCEECRTLKHYNSDCHGSFCPLHIRIWYMQGESHQTTQEIEQCFYERPEMLCKDCNKLVDDIKERVGTWCNECDQPRWQNWFRIHEECYCPRHKFRHSERWNESHTDWCP